MTKFEIEMDDKVDRKYGVVHAAGCRDLVDPEPVGDDWRVGVANLGTDWEMDVEDGAVKLAPCAQKIDRKG